MGLLFRNVSLPGQANADLRISGSLIDSVAEAGQICPHDGDEVIDAAGAALLPGLHDHHIHLFAAAAAASSVRCGPPEVFDEAQLVAALNAAAARAGSGNWLRGIGYDEAVAGDIDVAWLDQHLPEQPVRIQHRTGRLWILNSAALSRLQVTHDDPVERSDTRTRPTGRVLDGDDWLRARMQSLGDASRPDLSAFSAWLASRGVTGVTDAGVNNGRAELAAFAEARRNGTLRQSLLLMGNDELNGMADSEELAIGPRKFHLLESALPDMDECVAAVQRCHVAGRNAAFHCVTRVELVYALAVLEVAGVRAGDRIEHASVCPPEQLDEISRLGLIVVTQPVLVHDRGDRYLAEVDVHDQPWLYRLDGFLQQGIGLACSSDAPFGDPDPWLGIQAAVTRQTRAGEVLVGQEALVADQALLSYTAPLADPAAWRRALQVGDPADLCLLDRSWEQACRAFMAVQVRATYLSGEPIWQAGGDLR